MRNQILTEIRRLAASDGGRPPGQRLFARETGIAEHQWRGQFWARWGDALTEAGFQPNAWNERLDSANVLDAVIAACRHYGTLPTQDEIELYRKSYPSLPHPNVIRGHFGTRLNLIAALRKRAAEDNELADIAAMLPTQRATNSARSRGRGDHRRVRFT
jgi:hypothetical protein